MATGKSSDPPANSDQGLTAQIQARVAQAALGILRPLARLFVANGVPFRDAEQLLKQAFYDAGHQALSQASIKPNVSRISLSSGLHRREVKRLHDTGEGLTKQTNGRHSLASELYMRWSTDPQFYSGTMPLPIRSEQNPSFESLARQINNDAHPRSLLEELKRLGLVQVDEEGAQVSLCPGGFVPMFERTALLGLLGDNVGAHIDTAVTNVVEDRSKNLEQSICEDGLSARSIEDANALAREIWTQASSRIVPALRDAERHENDKSGTDKPGFHVRIGMYMYTTMPGNLPADDPQATDDSTAPQRDREAK